MLRTTIVTLSLALASSLALAQPMNEPTEMGQAMQHMDEHYFAVQQIIEDQEADLTSALEPLGQLQAQIVAAKGLTPPDLDQAKLNSAEAVHEIRTRMARTLSLAANLELALLDGDREAANDAFDAMNEVVMQGHRSLRNPLRASRNQRLLESLDDLKVSDELAAAIGGAYLFEPHRVEATIVRAEHGKLAIQFGERDPFVMRLQANGDLHLERIPRTFIRPIIEEGEIVAVEQHQSGNVYRGNPIDQ